MCGHGRHITLDGRPGRQPRPFDCQPSWIAKPGRSPDHLIIKEFSDFQNFGHSDNQAANKSLENNNSLTGMSNFGHQKHLSTKSILGSSAGGTPSIAKILKS